MINDSKNKGMRAMKKILCRIVVLLSLLTIISGVFGLQGKTPAGFTPILSLMTLFFLLIYDLKK